MGSTVDSDRKYGHFFWRILYIYDYMLFHALLWNMASYFTSDAHEPKGIE